MHHSNMPPSGLPVPGLEAKQAISHPNSRCSPRTKRGYPALCNLQPDDPYQCTCSLHVTPVVQTPQWLPIAFPVKPKYLPLILKAFYNETLKLTFSYLFRQLSFSCSRHPWFSAPFSAFLRNIFDPSYQSIHPMKHTIYNPSKPSFKVPRYLREAPSGLSQTKLVSLCRCVLSRT